MKETYHNTKENCRHYKGKIWLNGSIGTRGNICADTGREDLMVIAYVPEITEDNIVRSIEAMGWDAEYWLTYPTYKEGIEEMKKEWIGAIVEYKGERYIVEDVDYNRMLLIEKITDWNTIFGVEPYMVKRIDK